MNKILAVIRREFVEKVRTRAFLISTIGFPIFILLLMFLPALLLNRATATKRIAIVDGATGDLGVRIESVLALAKTEDSDKGRALYNPVLVRATDRVAEVQDSLIPFTGLSQRAGVEGFDGLLVVTEDAVVSGKLNYLGSNVSSLRDMGALERALRPVVMSERLRRAGVDPRVVTQALGTVNLTTEKVVGGRRTGESGAASFALGYAMGFLMYLGLLLYGVQVMTSIVEEKSSRIVEVLASSLTPFQMMLGKVVGVGSVGIFQLGVWVGTATLLTNYRTEIAGMLGISSAAVAGFSIPTLSPALFGVFLLFFVLGFLTFAAVYATVGSMCSTVQDTQQVQFPVMLVVIAGYISTFAVLNDPTGGLGRILTFVPFLSPFVVPVRYSINPVPLPIVALSALLSVVALLAVVWVGAKVYRVGILSYGKRATVREVWRWIRE